MAGSPKSHSGSQSQQAIWFILLAHGGNHIIIANESGLLEDQKA